MQIRYCLLVTSSGGEAQRVAVGDTPITVGRLPNASICIDETAVSRKHCVVTPAAGGLTLVDQGSTNGTFVNGIRRQHARLTHNDEIRIGTVMIRVQAQTSRDIGVMAAKAGDTLAPGINCPLQLNQQLALIVELGKRLTVAADTRQTTEAVLDAITEAFPAERALVIMGKPVWRDGGPKVFDSRVISDEFPKDHGLDEAVVKRVVATARTECRVPPGAKLDESPDSTPKKGEKGPVLCAPLTREDQVVGVLYADIKAGSLWVANDEVVSLFSAVADQASLALKKPGTPEEEVGTPPPPRPQSSHDTIPAEPPKRIRELEEARIALAEKLAQLEHLQQARATMSRGLVHDIKNLVGALHSNHSFIRQALSVGSDEIEAMDDAEEIARRIVAMAEDVLSVSQMEEGKLPLATRQVPLFDLLSRAMRRHSAHAREQSVRLTLGPIEEGLLAIIDLDIFDRLLDNLVGNAIRHAGRSGRVLLSGRFAHDQAEVTVADSGPGVPPPERGRIFTEWYCAGSSSGRHHGIGLYFCRVAAEAHGGNIRVEGTPGDNRFVVAVPASHRKGEMDEPTMVQLSPAGRAKRDKLLKQTIRD